MAEKRMFAKSIIDSDMFLDMPATAQLLYFHLCMRADDDGFINNPKRIMRDVRCSEDDIRMLIAKQYIIPFESGIIVIKHWRLHNYIKGDRYKSSLCEEKNRLKLNENKVYELTEQAPNQIGTALEPKWNQSGTTDKIRVDKNSIDILSDSSDRVSEIIAYLNEKAGTKYRPSTSKTKKLIHARMVEGFTLEDFKQVIDTKCSEWQGTNMAKYLRPETLFGTKFEGYLNEKPQGQKPADSWEEALRELDK